MSPQPRNEVVPGPFPAPPPRQGKGPGNEVDEQILSLSNFEYFVVGGTLMAKVEVIRVCSIG